MTKKTLLVVFIVCAICAIVIGWYAAKSDTAITQAKPVEKFRPSAQQKLSPVAAAPLSKEAYLAKLAKMPLANLLAEFEISGDSRFLDAAGKRFGDDPQFLMVAALASRSPNSPFLARLEAAQPKNALPNLLRAGMYAATKDWKEMAEQLQSANSKEALSLNSRERKAAMLDLLIADPNRSTQNGWVPATDRNFFGQSEAITRALDQNPNAFGGIEKAASEGLGLALKLRSMGDYDYWRGLYANGTELLLLRHVDGEVLYGDTGMTVSKRIEELNKAGSSSANWGSDLQCRLSTHHRRNDQKAIFCEGAC